jgi:hypothetical protein
MGAHRPKVAGTGDDDSVFDVCDLSAEPVPARVHCDVHRGIVGDDGWLGEGKVDRTEGGT